jgi:threonine dehydrogenase-like Zn-dependent dehydrogenase
MGEVMEVGPGNQKLKVGGREVVPFVIACGKCFFCERQQFSACDNSNPADNADMSETLYGHPMTGAFGYSHLTAGYPGGTGRIGSCAFLGCGTDRHSRRHRRRASVAC